MTLTVNHPCPYSPDHKNNGKVINKKFRYFAVCPECGRSARVTIYDHHDGTQACSLSRVGRRSTGNAKHGYSVRLSNYDIVALKNGKASLTVSNNRLRFQYKT